MKLEMLHIECSVLFTYFPFACSNHIISRIESQAIMNIAMLVFGCPDRKECRDICYCAVLKFTCALMNGKRAALGNLLIFPGLSVLMEEVGIIISSL